MSTLFNIKYDNWNDDASPILKDVKINKSHSQLVNQTHHSERAKSVLSKIKMNKTEEKFPKNKILKAHSKCKTWTDVLSYLNISYQAYRRLCKKYDIEELKADRRLTTKLSKQQSVEIWKLIEGEFILFDSPKKAADKLKMHQTSIHRIASNRNTNNKGKYKFLESIDGSLYTFEFTGKLISDGSNRTKSKQVKAYKLYEEFYKRYDSIEDANNDLKLSFNKQIAGKCFQTNGYKIYKK